MKENCRFLRCQCEFQTVGPVNWEKCRVCSIVSMLLQAESSGFQGNNQDVTEKIYLYFLNDPFCYFSSI